MNWIRRTKLTARAVRWHRLRNIPEISKPFASAQSIPLMKGFDDNDACNARSIVEVGDTSRKSLIMIILAEKRR
jgi:hypothetical protein